MKRSLFLVLRVLAALAIGVFLQELVRSSATPALVKLLVLLMAAVAAWRPEKALLGLAALAPFGTLLAPVPIRATEALVMAWLMGALLSVRSRRSRTADESPVNTRVLLPAWCYAAVVLASLAVRLSLRDVGLAPWPLLVSVLQSVGPNYLISAGLDLTLASAMLPIESVLLFIGVVLIGRHDRRVPSRVLAVLSAAAVAAALLTVMDVLTMFVRSRELRMLTRFLEGERFSVLGNDVNAAGSLLALTGTILVCYAGTRRRLSRVALVGVLAILPALWLTGSRAAAVALLLCGGAVLWWRSRLAAGATLQIPRGLTAIVGAAVLVTMSYGVWAAMRVDAPGSAARALGLRSQFLVTSVRMFRTAPWFGVGVGQYYGLSGEFMPEPLHRIYGLENAHNNFLQVATELGIVGIVVFGWLLVWPLMRAWRGMTTRPDDRVRLASTAGVVAYLLTCTTGHPLLVPEMAMPFWILLGAAVVASGCEPERTRAGRRRTAAVVAAGVLLLVAASFPFRAAAAMDTLTSAPVENGFREAGIASDGRPYRWIGAVAVFHIPSGAGLLEIPLRAPQLRPPKPFVVEVFVAGRLEERVTLPPNVWHTVAIPFREAFPFHFRKVALRANQTWLPGPEYHMHDGRPMSIWVGDWTFLPRDEPARRR